MSDKTLGLSAALASYFFWGLTPIYWKLLDNVPGVEVLAHRFIWSLVLLAGVILVLGQYGEVVKIFRNTKVFLLLAVTSVMISFNWGIYIITVNSGHVLQASLGYYINPFVSMLAGIIFFRERLNIFQCLAVISAAAGVAVYASGLKVFPWAALSLAFSFAAYGAIRKYVPVRALPGLFAETLIMLPAAAGFLIFLEYKGTGSFGHAPLSTELLLIGCGIITSLPLLCFGAAVKRLKLITVGLIQFTAPTVMLLLGVFAYGEPFTRVHAVTFGLIWLCVGFFTVDAILHMKGEAAKNKAA